MNSPLLLAKNMGQEALHPGVGTRMWTGLCFEGTRTRTRMMGTHERLSLLRGHFLVLACLLRRLIELLRLRMAVSPHG